MAAAIAWGGGGLVPERKDESGPSRSFERPDPVPREPLFGRCVGKLYFIWRDLPKLLEIVKVSLTEPFGLPKKITNENFEEWKKIQYKNLEICKGISERWRNKILPLFNLIQPILDKMDIKSQENIVEHDYDMLNIIQTGILGSIDIYKSQYHETLRYLGIEHQLKLWHTIGRLADIVEHKDRLLHARAP
jgi:hypothetical protein